LSEEDELLLTLRKLRELVGELYPVLVDEEGNIIDGWHRVKVNPNWHRKMVKCKDVSDKALVWLAAHARRSINPKELSVKMIQVAEKLLGEGVPRDQIVTKIAELTGYSERHVRRLLPAKYKAKEKARTSTVKLLYEEKPKPAEEKPAERKAPAKYLCPVCGAALAFVGDLLVPYHEALKRR
jgi:hypothetical protein